MARRQIPRDETDSWNDYWTDTPRRAKPAEHLVCKCGAETWAPYRRQWQRWLCSSCGVWNDRPQPRDKLLGE